MSVLSRFLTSRRPTQEPASKPAVPAGHRIYAVGDIHGRADLLARLHDRIVADGAASDASRKLLVYLGDYVDRGPQSREVIECLLEGPPPGFEAIYLKGNHEDMMLRFMATEPELGPGWFVIGGTPTLFSYGLKGLERGGGNEIARLEKISDQLREHVPEAHKNFLRSLKLWHEEGDYLFVHAGIRPGVPIAAQQEEDLLWIREFFLEDPRPHGKIVVHGHSITEAPEIRRNRIGIDTGAYATGQLTCLVLEGEQRSFLQTNQCA